jgi:heat shock protein HslJ
MSDDANPRPLVGLTFRVVELGGVPALEVPVAELTFGVDGRLSGCATINRVFGPYEIAGGQLICGALGTTMMAGLPDAMAQEQRLLEALSAPLTIGTVGPEGRIGLLTDDGPSLVLEYALLED